jgi:hypothetical protein
VTDGYAAINKNQTTLTCNPSTSTITATNFAGTATNATNVAVTATSSAAIHYLTLVTAGVGNKALFIDNAANNDLSYNPNANLLVARNIQTGSALGFSNTDLRIATNTTTNSIVFNNTDTTGNICNMNVNGLNMAATKKIASATTAGAELIFNVANATGNLVFEGTNIQSATSGGSSGQHLRIKLNGTFYKIVLQND